MTEGNSNKTQGVGYLVVAILSCPAVFFFGKYRALMDSPYEFSFVFFFPVLIALILIGVFFLINMIQLVIQLKRRQARLEITYKAGLVFNVLCLGLIIFFMLGGKLPPSMNKVVFPGEGYTAVAVSDDFVIALKEDGSIVGWGPEQRIQGIPQGNDFVAIDANLSFCFALKKDGQIIVWRVRPEPKDDTILRDVPQEKEFVAIAAGTWYCSALKDDGGIICWGEDPFGAFNDIPMADDFIAIDSDIYNLALKSNGVPIAWGRSGIIGYDRVTQVSPAPPYSNLIAIAIGPSAAVGLRNDGSLVAWSLSSEMKMMINVPKGSDYTTIAMGGNHALALRSDGSIVAWGSNSSGQAYSPRGRNYKSIVCYRNGSLAIDPKGRIIAWGAGCWNKSSFFDAQGK